MEFIKHTADGVPKGVKNDDLIVYRTQSASGELITHLPVTSKHLNWLKSDPNGRSKSRPSKYGEIVEYAICQKHEKKRYRN
jgi:hypothetical protein